MGKRRGAEAGDQNVRWLEELIAECDEAGTTLPTRSGALNHTEILKRVGPEGLNRHVLQDNQAFQQRLRDYAAEHGIRYSVKDGGNAESADDGEKDRRIRQLETKNAELVAQVADLKIKLREATAVATEIVPDGKRVALLLRYDQEFLGALDA